MTERGQVGNYMQSVSHNTAINCDKLAKIAHLLPFEYTEIHMNYLHSESSQNLAEVQKQKHSNRNCKPPTSSDLVAAYGCLVNFLLYQDKTRILVFEVM